MPELKLFKPVKLGFLELKNAVVMPSMTRSRATTEHIPVEIMAEYYAQRTEAGLIVTEGTAPSPDGAGYPRIPGIYSQEQIDAWKKVTSPVHAKGGIIFLQLMHTGRVSHPLNMPEGSEIIAPSAIKPEGEMRTDQEGKQPFPIPKEMNKEDIKKVKREFVKAAENAIEAGFDGVELHAANGYLLEQFLSPVTNHRKDEYGGNSENRARFVVDVAAAVAEAIGEDRVGIRISPDGASNGMKPYPEIQETYEYLAAQLDGLGLLYIHIIDNSSAGDPAPDNEVKKLIRDNFLGGLILTGGYTKEKAEADLQAGHANLIGFAKNFLANPDLVTRMKTDAELNTPDSSTFYTSGEKGYTDYPPLHD